MDDLAVAITRIQFFSGLAREDLARIVGKLEEEPVSAGQIVVRQGEVGDALYVVQSGAVEVVLEHDGAPVETVAVLGRYECFGEMSLFTGQKRSATVRALVDSVVLKLRKETWDELLAEFPSLSLHFCKVLSQRLAETDREYSKGRGALNQVMEEFFTAQPPRVQDFLVRTSLLRALEPQAIESVLSMSNPDKLLATLSSDHPLLLRLTNSGDYEYLGYLRDFLSAKLGQKIGKIEQDELHRRFASHFSGRGRWSLAIHHYLQAESWTEATWYIEAHENELLERESPEAILKWLDALPPALTRTNGRLSRLRAEAYVRLDDLDAAVDTFQNLLAGKEVSAKDALETARYYQALAELHEKKGEIGLALNCLRQGLNLLEGSWTNTDAVQAIQSVGIVQRASGSSEAALQSARRALDLARKLGTRPSAWPRSRKSLGLLLACALGLGLWWLPPPAPLDERGMHFLASLAAAVVLWIFDIFEEYVVALLLLLAWVLFRVVSPEMALAGFSQSSWFLVLGVLGMAATLVKSGLLYRVALQVLRHVPPNYTLYTFLLAASGLLVTPLLPRNQGRLAIVIPISQAISESVGFRPRSNGSAGLALSAYVGFGQMSFVFLTGATVCLVGWNLLPGPAKAEFGWVTWMVAALPAGVFTLFFLLAAIHVLFRLKGEDPVAVSPKTLRAQLQVLGPLSRHEWLGLAVLALTLFGWLGKPLHGMNEAWVALGAFLIFLMTGVLDKDGLKNHIDWGYLLFLGVVSSLAVIVPHLKIDRWLIDVIRPVLVTFSFHPLAFLIVVALLVYFVRFLLNKTPAVILLTLGLTSWAQDMGIHPGVLLLTILMAIECWFLPYQTDSYQIAYYSTDEKAFSHGQARKLMVAKFVASLLALTLSVPYWKTLGFVR